jgi:hypothetical protein
MELLLSKLKPSAEKPELQSSKERVLEFCRKNGVDINRFIQEGRVFPKNAYADELEKYPLLKD